MPKRFCHIRDEQEKESKGWFKYPKEKILETKIHKIPGYRYAINPNGFIIRYRQGGDPCPACGRILRGTQKKEIIELPHLGESYPIKKDPGWLYYLNTEGDICRVKWLGSIAIFKAVFKVDPSPEEVIWLTKALAIRKTLKDQASMISVSLAEEFLKEQRTQKIKKEEEQEPEIPNQPNQQQPQ